MAELSRLAAKGKAKPKLRVTRTPAKKTVSAKRQAASHDTPVHRFVAELSKQTGVAYQTTVEVADQLGVSRSLIRKIQRKNPYGVPSMAVMFGRLQVFLYTAEDVEIIRGYLKERQGQLPYANPNRDSNVESWEEVIRRRERTQADADSAQRSDTGEADASAGGAETGT